MANIKSLSPFELFCWAAVSSHCFPFCFVSNGNTHVSAPSSRIQAVYSWDQNAAYTSQGELSYQKTIVSPKGST